MIKKSIETVKNNIWKTVTVVVTVFSIIGGVWAMEDRYANKEVTLVAVENLQTQQENFQMQQRSFQIQQELSIRERKIEIIKAKLEFYNMTKDELNKEIAVLQRWLDTHSQEQVSKDRLKELEKARDRVQLKIDILMEQLSEVE